MKDRYDNFFDAQQDPYEYDADGENDAEEYEEDELEDEESLEDDDESYEDDELEDEDDSEEYSEEEEEEEVPAAPAASSRPFGNSLNIQLNDRNRNNGGGNNQGNTARPNGNAPQNRPQGAGQGLVFKQVKPAAPTVNGAAPPNRPAAANPSARPVQAVSLNRNAPKEEEPVDAQVANDETAEEFESPRTGVFSKLAPWNWGKSRRIELEDEASDPDEEETTGEEREEDDAERPGRFRRFFSRFSRSSDETEAEAEDTDEEEIAAPETKIARLGQRVSKKFSSLSNRVRGRLRTDETLDEFKENLAESEEEFDEVPHGRLRRLVKTGMIGGAAAILVFACWTGYKHLTGSKSDPDAAAGLASFDGKENDTLSGLSSRAESDGLETTPLDSIAEEFDTLGDTLSDQTDSLKDQVDSLSGKVGEKIDSVTAALTSGVNDALDKLDGDLLSNDDPAADSRGGEALGAVAAGAAAAAAGVAALSNGNGSSDNGLDFDFGTSDDGALSVSETTPAYGDNQAGGLSFDQLKENLAETGEQLKDGFQSGVEKVDDSLKKAGEKTGEFFDQVGQKISGSAQELKQEFKDDMAQAGGQAQDAAQKVGDWASNTYDAAKEKVGDAASSIKSELNQAGTQAQDAAQKVGDWASNTYDSARGKVGDAASNIKSELNQAGTQAQDAAQKVGDWANETFQSPQSTAGTVPSAAPQSTVGTLQSGGGQTQGLSLGQKNPSEPLFLETSARKSSAASSLGGSANQFQSASTAVSGGRNTPLGTASLAQNNGAAGSLNNGLGSTPTAGALTSSLGNTAQSAPPAQSGTQLQESAPLSSNETAGALNNTPRSAAAAQLPAQGNTAPVSAAPAEIQDALAQEAAAARSAAAQQAEVVQGQTPDETFAAETDLSSIGFEAPRVEDGDPLSNSLSPFGSQYSLPEETVPAANLNAAVPNTANLGSNAPAAGQPAQQLSSLDYNPADPAASARYNNGQTGISFAGNSLSGITSPGSEYRQYRTKAGDNLIKIAENELGDGTRWSEISKLNANIDLRGRLDEGLIILLPPKNSGN